MAKGKGNGEALTVATLPRYIIYGITTAIAFITYYFWAFPYRAALSYREQLQLFQTTRVYFNDLIARPAGLSTYLGEYLTQFFNNFWIGSAFMTALLLLFLLLCYLINNKFASHGSKVTNIVLSLIPFISLWMFLGNPDVTLSFVVALVISTAGAYIFTDIKNDVTKAEMYVPMIAGTALLFWMAGPGSVVFTLLCIAYVCKHKSVSIKSRIIFALTSLIWLAANASIWSFFLSYPFSYQMIGIGYLMTPNTLDAGQIIVEVLCVVIPAIAKLIAAIPQKVTIPVFIALEVIAAIILYPMTYNQTTYRLIDYDYMVRANDWEGILRYSDEHNPELPLSVSATNLALGMTGQLDSHAFDYYQNGTEGLIPPFVKETLSSWTTGEIFFQLGMINSAQRFYFEGMEAIPNYNKSSRAVRRLAETAIIRGEYNLARKYLLLLENTTFYKKWAQRNLELIKDPHAIDNHPLYGPLRKKMINEHYLFSEGELDKTLGQLFLKNPGNNLAKQYLILYPLLQRDLNKFIQYMGVVAEDQPQYNPLLAQQALAFISMKNGQTIPSNVVPSMVEQSLRNFAQAWISKNPELIEPYRHTLYYYLISNE